MLLKKPTDLSQNKKGWGGQPQIRARIFNLLTDYVFESNTNQTKQNKTDKNSARTIIHLK